MVAVDEKDKKNNQIIKINFKQIKNKIKYESNQQAILKVANRIIWK